MKELHIPIFYYVTYIFFPISLMVFLLRSTSNAYIPIRPKASATFVVVVENER